MGAKMTSRENRWPLVLMGLCVVAGVAIAFALMPSEPALEPVYLPPEVERVEIVPQSYLDDLAASHTLNDDLELENGRLVDENGRLMRVVDFLQVVTEAAPATEPAAELISEACDEGEVRKLEYRAGVEAFLFEGEDADGTYTSGWRGYTFCEVRRDASAWRVLASAPFSLSHVVAQTSVQPAPPRRPRRWYAGLHYSVLRDSTSFSLASDRDNPATFAFNPASLRVYGGRRWFPLKRYTIRTGVFGDSGAVGLDVGLDW